MLRYAIARWYDSTGFLSTESSATMIARIVHALIVLQAASVWIAVAASVVEIESIVVSGPVLSFSGLIIAVCCLPRGWRYGLAFALSVPTISVACFSLIYGLSWSPDDASRPVSLLLFCFGLAEIPLALFALRDVRTGALHPGRTFQFGVSSLIVLTAAVSIPLALYRAGPMMTALGIILAYGVLLVAIVRSSQRGKEADLLPFESPATLEVTSSINHAPTASAADGPSYR
jgi:hypothetical protein